ncbi:cytochrome P450 [Deinococcus peraridilitoris]|uniref:Cytochrome P450 n=1 Tax=Deinococcus peraridilitoris (strain DSM 19664 / LMG 22246 / CIP 109416 / KR-200) TaxID=937777 RepID=L0A647_DEIPD|nr:cytochrome P450 [Deinococcus peraridilitoris]AFZ68622.1 cytochrome P450 [Deinococcus peraridilitoris DSM 19664]
MTTTTQNPCPFPFRPAEAARPGEQKTNQGAPHVGPAIVRDPSGVFHVHGFDAARAVLRSELVRQAGFGAELVSEVAVLNNDPVLFAEGEQHHEMRRQTARYFTPTAVTSYRRMMEGLADDLVGELVTRGHARLDELSLRLAVRVAAQVVGLTDSRLPGMGRRIEAFVQGGASAQAGGAFSRRLAGLRNRAQLLSFYLLDVKPAIRKRQRRAQDDVISHVISKGYTDLEVLTECLTYGTAGMVTTREFICAAAWHLLEHSDLRREYLFASQSERHAILHEILRLEPVVARLVRRATADLSVGETHIPQHSLIVLHLQDVNADADTVGPLPRSLCPHRPLPRGVQAPVMSFGDGHHRCPGAFVAIQESDVFLRRLLWLPDLKVVSPPRLGYNELIHGYELRGFQLSVGAG